MSHLVTSLGIFTLACWGIPRCGCAYQKSCCRRFCVGILIHIFVTIHIWRPNLKHEAHMSELSFTSPVKDQDSPWPAMPVETWVHSSSPLSASLFSRFASRGVGEAGDAWVEAPSEDRIGTGVRRGATPLGLEVAVSALSPTKKFPGHSSSHTGHVSDCFMRKKLAIQ
jgi:hypothetical protein